MTVPVAQQASHDYLRAACDLMEHGATEWAVLAGRAADAEVNDPQTVVGEMCQCDDCMEYLTEARLRRAVGWA